MKRGRLLPVSRRWRSWRRLHCVAATRSTADCTRRRQRLSRALGSHAQIAGRANYASWLEITPAEREDSGAHGRPLGPRAAVCRAAELVNGGIRFVSPKEEEGRTDADMVFEGRLARTGLVGNTSGPDGRRWTWRGERAPSLERKSAPQWGTPVTLFNGKDLGGWHLSDPKAGTPGRFRTESSSVPDAAPIS